MGLIRYVFSHIRTILFLVLLYIFTQQVRYTIKLNYRIKDHAIIQKSYSQNYRFKFLETNANESSQKINNMEDKLTILSGSEINNTASILNKSFHEDLNQTNSILKAFDIVAFDIMNNDVMHYQRPNYLHNLKSPCFLWKDLSAIKRRKHVNKLSHSIHTSETLACLPNIFIVGVSKCGTTDVYAHLLQHQHVIGAPLKEPHFWDKLWTPQIKQSVKSYLENYDIFASIIEDCYVDFNEKLCKKSITPYRWTVKVKINLDKIGKMMQEMKTAGKSCPLVSIDGSTTYLNTEVFWDKSFLNRGHDEPHILTPHRIQHIIPNPKILVLLREPIDRLVSDFYFFVEEKSKRTPVYFHRLVVNGIKWWKNCVHKLTELRCAYGSNYTGTGVENLGTGLFSWGDSTFINHNGAGRLRIGMYVIYIQKWMEVFDKSELMIQKLEDYNTNSTYILEKGILPFLKLDPLDEDSRVKLLKMERVGHKNKARFKKKGILPETKELLMELYKPYNVRLAKLLQDNRYLWK